MMERRIQKDKPPRISIVIPSFNKVDFINKTLQSIVVQNYPNLEVIVQDGGSTDGTVEIVKKFANKYPKIFYWESKKDGGQLEAINKGLKKATGEILTFINADDVYKEESFKSVSEAYSLSPQALWFTGKGKIINDKGFEIAEFVTWYKNILLYLNSFKFLLITNYLVQPSVFLTKKAYQLYGPFTGTSNFVLEYDLWLRLARIQMPVVIKNYLSCFRMTPNNITSKIFNEILNLDQKIVKKYTGNKLLIFLHKLNNIARIVIQKITI